MTTVPLTIFDRQVTRIVMRKLFIYPRGLDAGRLIETLPHALYAYPLLAGRLRGSPHGPVFDTTPRGVRLVIADHDAPTPRRLEPAEATRAIDRHVAPPGRDAPLLTIQINRMRDGGAILGLANNHAAMDGSSSFQFLGHWAALARGETGTPPPCHRRGELEALCRDTPAAAPANVGLRPAKLRELLGLGAYMLGARVLLDRVLLEFSGDEMAALKARARAELPAGSTAAISSNDALTAHLWATLEGLDGPGAGRPLGLITDARGVAGALGGPRYFGNFNDLAIVPRPASGTLGDRAAALRTIGPAWSAAHTLARGRLLQDVERGGPRLFPAGVLDTLRGALLINNWSRFPIYVLDFGRGTPSWYDIPLVPLPRMTIVMPHPEDPGGRIVHLTVTRADRRALAAKRP